MFKLFRKKLNKKGFTLAEMLIVVAIIAILVAIAIPIFMNSLAKAENAAAQANIRSVKAAAINKILDEWDTGDKLGTYDTNEVANRWQVDAQVENGNINNCTVKAVGSTKTTGATVTEKCDKSDEGDHYKYDITIEVKDTDVKKAS